MSTEFSPEQIEIASLDFIGGHYATLLAEVDKLGPPGTTLDYGVGIHPSLHISTLKQPTQSTHDLLNAIDQHAEYVSGIADPIRRNPLLVSLRGLASRLRLLSGDSISPSQMAYDAYNIALPDEPYNDSWVAKFYEQEVLPLIPKRFFPEGIRTPENLLSAYNAFKDCYRLNVLRSSDGSKQQQEERLKELGKYTARLIFERAEEKQILTFNSVDAALEPLKIVPIIDSQGGESGYFRFDEEGKPEDTLNWQSKSEPTPWELLLTQSHELAGHYQEYTEKIAMAWKRGWTEWTVAGLYSPAAFFSEGVAQIVPMYLYSDPESVLEASLEIYKHVGQQMGPEERADILNLIKIHQLTEFNPALEPNRINSSLHFENALLMNDGPEKSSAIEEAKKYFQTMCLRSDEQTERRIKFMKKYGGYTYVYPASAQAYWAWFEQEDKTPEALLRLMREPIILGVNEDVS